MDALPTVFHLAAANEQQVLRLWEGLGYYRRARHLHRAARMLVEQHGGELPNDPAVWRTLPGVGRYTLGAVLSQAFDRRLPIIEANSRRVLCRLFARRGDPSRAPLLNWLWTTAETLLPSRHVGDFNQALMDLGALVCTPTEPNCPRCPLRHQCDARSRGLQHFIPERPPEPSATLVEEVAVVMSHVDKVLLVRRPETGLWADLWEFPHGAVRAEESPKSAGVRLICELTGFEANVGDELLTIRHGVTRYRITMRCYGALRIRGRWRSAFYREAVWVEPNRLSEYPVSAPQRRLAAVVSKRYDENKEVRS